jgi:adenosylhomocysteine nucleosidase
MSRTVIIAAMEREVQPLVRGWGRSSISDGTRAFTAFESGERAVVISGIGRTHAGAAARAAISQYRPAELISAGLAGALIRSLKAGSVFTPNVVVDAADGSEYRCTAQAGGVVGGGVLVSAAEISSVEAKQRLVEHFHGLVVDMEAAGVAIAAQEAGLGFRCVKAISDEANFVMPPLEKFVDAAGNFQAGRFAAWTAVHPLQWKRVMTLGRNTSKAVRALFEWLEKNAACGAPGEIGTLERTELQNGVPSDHPGDGEAQARVPVPQKS